MKLFPFAIACALVLYITTLPAFFLQQPEHDEALTLLIAEGVTKYGTPLTYFNEVSGLQYGYVHPPLYFYLISWTDTLFHNLLFSSRILGILSLLAVFVLSLLIIRRIFPDYTHIPIIFTILFFINPVIIRKSYLILFDTSLLAVAILLFAYLFLRCPAPRTMLQHLLLIATFTILLWIKFTTPYVLLGSILLFLALQRKGRALLSYAVMGIISTTLFIATWYIYTKLINGPFLIPFQATLFNRIASPLSPLLILTHLSGFIYHLFWLSPLFFVLLGVAAYGRLRNLLRTKTFAASDFLLLFVAAMWFAHLIRAPNINYLYPVIPLALILIAERIAHFRAFPKKPSQLLAMAILFLFFLLLPDPILALQDILPWNPGSAMLLIALMLSLLPLLALAYPLLKKDIRLLALLSVIIMAPMNLSLLITQATADYSTAVLYGEQGYAETVAYAQQHIPPGSLIITEQSIGFLTQTRFYSAQQLMAFNLCGEPTTTRGITNSTCDFGLIPDDYNLTDLVASSTIPYIIYSDFPREVKGGLSSEAVAVLGKYYALERQFGNFYVYKRKDDAKTAR
ncbi:hypothetical protein HY491_01570 [Candidatus Woesearchaeota archaeon]|nr:hypothetical protein [Candidatus Woesearchaeota archaeon]